MGQTRRELLTRCWTSGVVLLASTARPGRGDEPPKKETDEPPVKGRTPEEARWEAWWADLEKGEEEATRALLNMADHRREAVAFLKEKLQPLVLTPGRLKDLLAWLGSDDNDVWMTAFEELEYFDPRLAVGLELLIEKTTEYPVRSRLVEVLSGRPAGSLAGKKVGILGVGNGGFNFLMEPGGTWWAEHQLELVNSTPARNPKRKWTRAVRAIALLEHIGTPEAAAILKAMATGNPEAQPTRAAKDALRRLDPKPL
jgi:hypothetical protein